jgi:ribose transport system permease protein
MSETARHLPRLLQPSRFRLSRGLLTMLVSLMVLAVVCLVFAPSSISAGSLSGSLPFAGVLAIVGLGQMLVVQQGGFDLSLAGGVSLAVVLATHVPAGHEAELLPIIMLAFGCSIVTGLANGLMVSVLRLNAIIATIGMNALLYGAVFAVSGGVPRTTTALLADIAGGSTAWLGNAVWFMLILLLLIQFVLKKSVAGRRFEAIGANPVAARAVGLRVRLHQTMAYVWAQILYCTAGIIIAGLTRQPTAYQGDSMLLPSVAVVVLGGTSLLGGRGYPVATVAAALFLNQLSQFALAVGVPYSAQTIIQALALGFGIAAYSVRLKN